MSGNVDITPTSQDKCQPYELPAEKTMQVNHKRRVLVQKIAVSSAALACCSIIPAQWSRPLIEFGTLPAHATTSAPTISDIIKLIEDEVAPAEKPDQTDPAATSAGDSLYNKTERIDYSGDISIDKILRRKFASDKVGTQYGKSMRIVF